MLYNSIETFQKFFRITLSRDNDMSKLITKDQTTSFKLKLKKVRNIPKTFPG